MPGSALGLGEPTPSQAGNSARGGRKVPLAPATSPDDVLLDRTCSPQVGQAGDASKCKLQEEPEKIKP